jgi:hypothetical protein
MTTRNFLGVKSGREGWQPCHLHVPNILKSGSLKILEFSGPVQACNGTASPFTHPSYIQFCTFTKTDAVTEQNSEVEATLILRIPIPILSHDTKAKYFHPRPTLKFNLSYINIVHVYCFNYKMMKNQFLWHDKPCGLVYCYLRVKGANFFRNVGNCLLDGMTWRHRSLKSSVYGLSTDFVISFSCQKKNLDAKNVKNFALGKGQSFGL